MSAELETTPRPDGQYNLPPKPGKRLWRLRLAGLAAVLLVLGAGWSGLWYWAAGKLEITMDAQVERLTRAGIKAGCEARTVTGYPFRLGIRCERVSGSSARGLIEAGALRSAAQLYAPGKMVVELDGPMTVEPVHGAPLLVEWGLARASSFVQLSALPETEIERLSVELREPRLKDGWNLAAPPLATAGNAQLHYRRAPDSDTDIDIAANAQTLTVAATRLPPMAGSLSARIEALRPALAPGFSLASHIAEFGLKGRLHHLRLRDDADPAGGQIEFSGPFEVDRAGLLSGRVKLVLSSIEAARPFAHSLLGGQSQAVDDLLKIVALLPSNGTDGKERSVVLRIEKGIVSAGVLELGRIPPLI